jgi:hypothetical protein
MRRKSIASVLLGLAAALAGIFLRLTDLTDSVLFFWSTETPFVKSDSGLSSGRFGACWLVYSRIILLFMGQLDIKK